MICFVSKSNRGNPVFSLLFFCEEWVFVLMTVTVVILNRVIVDSYSV
jgi:hypothetical protein